jgi:hypothetical protein
LWISKNVTHAIDRAGRNAGVNKDSRPLLTRSHTQPMIDQALENRLVFMAARIILKTWIRFKFKPCPTRYEPEGAAYFQAGMSLSQ